MIGLAGLVVAACGGGGGPETEAAAPDEAETATETGGETAASESTGVESVELHKLDCGTIGVSNLDDFSSTGEWAGLSDTFTDTCWLIRHPDGDMVWDTGVPGMMAGQPAMTQDIYTVSLAATLSAQLREKGIEPSDIDYVAVSHSHFDHVGQIDQVSGATWLVPEVEHDFMFPDNTEGETEAATQFSAFAQMEMVPFTGEYDVFGDGSVIIFPTPGHTPGHTSLQVMLEETGPVLLTGDLYHRDESRSERHVPRFNTDEAATLASMDEFEARAQHLGAMVIIQHEPDDVDPLPDVMK
jgi:glyoxylase-like metal-dependent hydrolase (beta-lactamase superfamily II)